MLSIHVSGQLRSDLTIIFIIFIITITINMIIIAIIIIIYNKGGAMPKGDDPS